MLAIIPLDFATILLIGAVVATMAATVMASKNVSLNFKRKPDDTDPEPPDPAHDILPATPRRRFVTGNSARQRLLDIPPVDTLPKTERARTQPGAPNQPSAPQAPLPRNERDEVLAAREVVDELLERDPDRIAKLLTTWIQMPNTNDTTKRPRP